MKSTIKQNPNIKIPDTRRILVYFLSVRSPYLFSKLLLYRYIFPLPVSYGINSLLFLFQNINLIKWYWKKVNNGSMEIKELLMKKAIDNSNHIIEK